jgi:hypothetical protein
MDLRKYRCGTSNEVYYRAPAGRADREPERLHTRLHLPQKQVMSGGYRVVAQLAGGEQVPLCLADTAQQAQEAHRALTGRLPADAVWLLVQRWDGTAGRGRWEELPGGRRLVRRRPRRRKGRQ